MIPFNVPTYTGREPAYMQKVVQNRKYSGDGEFANKCHSWFKEKLGCAAALLTPSGTHALEMAALLIGIKEGDEVIMPSYTFTSTANAFVLRGARIVFVDIRPDTMNIDEKLIEAAVTEKTKAIVPVHYAGVACEMDAILSIAEKHSLFVVEDAAQALMSTYKGKQCGTLGHFGCFSFHETKNIQCGEGGALLISDKRFIERAEVIREKGTDRARFHRGQVDKYTWRDLGSSYLLSEINAAFLWAQLEVAVEITADRMKSWMRYYERLQDLSRAGIIHLPTATGERRHNAHVFYIKVKNRQYRDELVEHLAKHGIPALFHYIPLHTAQAGRGYCRFVGSDYHTAHESERLIRLPLFHGMKSGQVDEVVERIVEWHEKASV